MHLESANKSSGIKNLERKTLSIYLIPGNFFTEIPFFLFFFLRACGVTMRTGADKAKQKPPHAFVVEALSALNPEARRLFSGFGIYVGDKIVLMLRDRPQFPQDNGVWIVLSEETDPRDASLRKEFPSLRKIGLLGGKIGHWLLIPGDGPRFEQEAMRACELVLQRDPRLGRVPASRRSTARKRV
jgi:hypothetical protein